MTGVILPHEKNGVPLNERFLPQALREAGYQTAISGKWHLGSARRAFLPTQRGFDHQYGHYSGMIDYFKHDRLGGHDWHRDDKANYDEGYSTDLIAREAETRIVQRDKSKPFFLYVAFNAPHSPLQAPPEEIAKYAFIEDPKRRTYAAMVSRMDEQIGRITATLEREGLSDNTLLIFSSDNGGTSKEAGRNLPLRGDKSSNYEGGIRVPAFAVWSGKIAPGTVVNEPLHVVDWYPTMLGLAGASLEQPLPLDGRDLWPTLSENRPMAPRDILLNLWPGNGALRRGNWKVFVRNVAVPAGAGGQKDKPATTPVIELFDLSRDPNETTNVAEQHPEIASQMHAALEAFRRDAVFYPSEPKPADFKAPLVYGEGEE